MSPSTPICRFRPTVAVFIDAASSAACRRTPLAAALALALAAPFAPAMAMPEDGASPAQAVPVVTVQGNAGAGYQTAAAAGTTRTDTPLIDVPASVQVVPREVLADRGVTRTDQLLDNVSGVLAESSYGGNGATFFNIRGFSENNGLRDGFRDYGYLAYRDVQNVERVEVFKGPAGALYGGVGAIGGYVNTVSRRPASGAAADAGEATISIGSDGLRRATIDVNRALDDALTVRVNGAAGRDGGFRDDAGTASWSIAPAIAWRDKRGNAITLLTELNHLRRDGFDFGVPNVRDYAALSRTRYYGLTGGAIPGAAGDYGRNDTSAATLEIEHPLNENWLLRVGAHAAYAHQVSQQSFPDLGGYAGGRLLDVDVYAGANEASRQYDVRAELVGTVVAAGMRHALLVGVDAGTLAQGGAGASVSAFTLDLFDPATRSTLTALSPAGPYHEARGRDTGAYVQDLVDVAPRWKVQLGLRADRFVNRELLGDATVARGSESALSPRVGVVYRASEVTSVFADWSRSHAPNVAHGASTSTYDAEVGAQAEVGVKHEFIKDRLRSTLAVFDLTRSNILSADPNDPTREVLSGRQASRGVEFDVAGALTAAWKLIGAYTYTNAVVKSATDGTVGQRLSNVPRHHASLWSTYHVQAPAWRGFGAGAGLVYVGEREANLPATYRLPAWVRADAALYWQDGRWRAQLNATNLFNRRYVTGGAASVFNYTLAPSRPAEAQLTVAYRF